MTREEKRSLALHRALARRLISSPEATLKQARITLRRMAKVVAPRSQLLREWAIILKRPPSAIVHAMLDPSPWGRELRHVTPFAGVLDARERADVYRAFKRDAEIATT
jgi:hypothetical protein